MRNCKVTVLGAGNVGATIAYTLTIEGICDEIVLVDINKNKAIGEAADISQGLAFSNGMNIYAGEYEDAKDSDIVIVTLGTARKPGQTRINLAQTNVNIIKDVMPKVVKIAPDAIYIIVSNPVDILTYATIKCTGLPASRVIGSGTLLDSSRLKSIISKKIDISPKNVHAHVLGEHGDTSVVPWSLATVFGMPVEEYCMNTGVDFTLNLPEEKAAVEDEMRNAGAKVIAKKSATFYAIAMSVKQIVETILRNNPTILTVSGLLNGEYGLSDVCISLPFIVDQNGLRHSLTPTLTENEKELIKNSADNMKEILSTLQF